CASGCIPAGSPMTEKCATCRAPERKNRFTGNGAYTSGIGMRIVTPYFSLVWLRRGHGRVCTRQVKQVVDSLHALHPLDSLQDGVDLLGVLHLATHLDHSMLRVDVDLAFGYVRVAEQLGLYLVGQGGIVKRGLVVLTYV